MSSNLWVKQRVFVWFGWRSAIWNLNSEFQISRYLGSYAAPCLQPHLGTWWLKHAIHYESSHVYSVNTRRSHQAPKMQRTRQKKTMYIVIQLICENTNMKKNNFLDCNYSWWTLTTLNLKGRYVGICQLQDNFFNPFLGTDTNSIAKAWNAKSWNWIGCLNSIAKAWNAKSCNWIGCLNSIAKAWNAKSWNWIGCLNSIAKAWNAKSWNWIGCLNSIAKAWSAKSWNWSPLF